MEASTRRGPCFAGKCGYHERSPMLDLKSKLAAAGLVTQEDVDRVEKAKRGPKKPKRGGRGRAGKGAPDRAALAEVLVPASPKGQDLASDEALR